MKFYLEMRKVLLFWDVGFNIFINCYLGVVYENNVPPHHEPHGY